MDELETLKATRSHVERKRGFAESRAAVAATLRSVMASLDAQKRTADAKAQREQARLDSLEREAEIAIGTDIASRLSADLLPLVALFRDNARAATEQIAIAIANANVECIESLGADLTAPRHLTLAFARDRIATHPEALPRLFGHVTRLTEGGGTLVKATAAMAAMAASNTPAAMRALLELEEAVTTVATQGPGSVDPVYLEHSRALLDVYATSATEGHFHSQRELAEVQAQAARQAADIAAYEEERQEICDFRAGRTDGAGKSPAWAEAASRAPETLFGPLQAQAPAPTQPKSAPSPSPARERSPNWTGRRKAAPAPAADESAPEDSDAPAVLEISENLLQRLPEA